MSRAFVKEDVDPPERRRRPRSSSGLPPGAANYMTALGAKRLREKLAKLRQKGAASAAAELEEMLAAATIVEPPEDRAQVAFGATVTVRDAGGAHRIFQIVGVDEIALHADAVSWISPTGKALLAGEVGERVTLDSGERVEIVAVDYLNE